MPRATTPSFLRGNYPLDLDAGLRYVRPRSGIDFFPSPIIGMANNIPFQFVSAMLPQMNVEIWMQAFGKKAFGPGVNSTPLNLQWQITVPGLTKMGYL